MVNSTKFDSRFKSKRKSQKKRNKKDISNRKFRSIAKNFTILQGKIHSIRIQMTSTNAEFNGEFNDIPLKIQLETKITEHNKQKAHLEEKICLNYTKFHNFTRATSLNQN